MFRRTRLNFACAPAVVLLAGSLSLFAAPQAQAWEITDLGTLPGGTFTIGSAVNDSGQVVGSGDLTPRFNQLGERIDTPFAFISAPRGGPLTMIDPGPADLFLSRFSAEAVNNTGQVAGTALQGSSFPFAYVTDDNGANLHLVTGDAATSGFANSVDINNAGTVLYQSLGGGVRVVEEDGTITEIRSDTDTGNAIAINDDRQVVFNAPIDQQTGQSNGFMWSVSTGIQPILANGSLTDAYDINNAGQILGLAQGPDGGMFIAGIDGITMNLVDLPDGTMLDLSGGIFPKFNDSAQIIGMLEQANGDSFAFITGVNGEDFINLETLPEVALAGWSDLVVSGINSFGEIAGTGMLNGATRAFFLSPAPEPETWAMMLAGLGLLAWLGRRRMTVAASA